jgi:nucleoside 2-deoxyribosyltransferase
MPGVLPQYGANEIEMKIAICSSMVFTEKMLEIKDKLENLGHEAFVSKFAEAYLGKTVKEIEALTLYHKNERDAIREFWKIINISDAVLVLNYDRRGVPNYIGGNTLMELGFAHVLNKKIFLMNPIPEIEYYQSEIEAVRPIILNENLERIR